MKPQCETAADCLRELARVMDQFGIDDPIEAVNSKYITHTINWSFANIPNFTNPENWNFAIAEIEGKPVFIGDTVYDYAGEAHLAPYLNDGTKMNFGKGHEWSLTPPKPKTVMVELDVEDAECFVLPDAVLPPPWHKRLSDACKKALEELK